MLVSKVKQMQLETFLESKVTSEVTGRTHRKVLFQRVGEQEWNGCTPELVLILGTDRVIPLFDLTEQDGSDGASYRMNRRVLQNKFRGRCQFPASEEESIINHRILSWALPSPRMEARKLLSKRDNNNMAEATSKEKFEAAVEVIHTLPKNGEKFVRIRADFNAVGLLYRMEMTQGESYCETFLCATCKKNIINRHDDLGRYSDPSTVRRNLAPTAGDNDILDSVTELTWRHSEQMVTVCWPRIAFRSLTDPAFDPTLLCAVSNLSVNQLVSACMFTTYITSMYNACHAINK